MSEEVLTPKKVPVGQMMTCTAGEVDLQLNTVRRQCILKKVIEDLKVHETHRERRSVWRRERRERRPVGERLVIRSNVLYVSVSLSAAPCRGKGVFLPSDLNMQACQCRVPPPPSARVHTLDILGASARAGESLTTDRFTQARRITPRSSSRQAPEKRPQPFIGLLLADARFDLSLYGARWRSDAVARRWPRSWTRR